MSRRQEEGAGDRRKEQEARRKGQEARRQQN